MALALGIIPQWQFSQDPAVNYNLNPVMTFPPGMNQLTVQPINNVVPSGDRDLQGLPLFRRTSRNGVRGLGITMANWMKPAAAGAGISGLFDSWAWTNRKWLVMGGLGLLGIGAALVATKVLR